MPLPLGIVGSEGKQLDINFIEKQSGPRSGTSNRWGFNQAFIDSQANIYTISRDSATLTKQTYAGILVWSYFNNAYTFTSFTTDANGNSYVLGYNTGFTASRIYKITTFGTVAWSKEFTIDGGYFLGGEHSVVVCPLGFVYVAGGIQPTGAFTQNGVGVIKFDSNGNVQWTQRIVINLATTEWMGLAVNNATNSYAMLFRKGDVTRVGYIGYGSITTGALSWLRTLSEIIPAGVQQYNCVLDTAGNVYFGINYSSTTGTIYKLSFNGTELLQRSFTISGLPSQSPASVLITPIQMTLAPDGNSIYIISQVGQYQVVGKVDLNLNSIYWRGMTTNYTTPQVNGIAISPIKNFMFVCSTIPNNGVIANTGLGWKVPIDGSKTGTTIWGGESYTYASATATIATTAFFNDPATITQNAATFQEALWSPSLSSSPVTITQTTIN